MKMILASTEKLIAMSYVSLQCQKLEIILHLKEYYGRFLSWNAMNIKMMRDKSNIFLGLIEVSTEKRTENSLHNALMQFSFLFGWYLNQHEKNIRFIS